MQVRRRTANCLPRHPRVSNLQCSSWSGLKSLDMYHLPRNLIRKRSVSKKQLRQQQKEQHPTIEDLMVNIGCSKRGVNVARSLICGLSCRALSHFQTARANTSQLAAVHNNGSSPHNTLKQHFSTFSLFVHPYNNLPHAIH